MTYFDKQGRDRRQLSALPWLPVQLRVDAKAPELTAGLVLVGPFVRGKTL